MISIDLKELIMNALKEQREILLGKTAALAIEKAYSGNSMDDLFEALVFSDNDIFENALNSLSFNYLDIDPNDFRDYQNETVDLLKCSFARYSGELLELMKK